MSFYEYEVIGNRRYRGHDKGTIFEARHDPAKQRAIERGDIRLLRVHDPEVPKDRTYPEGWLTPKRAAPSPNNEGRESGPQS